MLKKWIVERVLRGLVRREPESLADLLVELIDRRNHTLSPIEALRFLMRLDGRLYEMEGSKAVEHGSGIHPKHRLTHYHDFFVRRIQQGERVLDVGCGNGALTYAVAQGSGATVVAIDMNPDSIRTAESRFSHPGVRYVLGDVLSDLPQEAFDVVMLSNVLEHLPNRVDFLRQLVQVARPAKLLIRVPTFERDWRVPLKKELGVEWRLDRTHETEYTLESFEEEMRAANLEITHREVRWGEIWAEVRPR